METKNPIRRVLSASRPILNGWLMMPGAFGAELMAGQGFDSLTIDMQHGLVGYTDMVAMLQGIRSVPALVRVPWLDPGPVMGALDAGAWGVICPMIDSAEQAAQLVSFVRYPPAGRRSMGPVRASHALGDDYTKWADDEVLCLAMIETAQGFSNLETIVSTPGLDGVYVGPSDLTLAMTGRKYRIGFDREEVEVVEALHLIAETCQRHGKLAALHTGSLDYARRAIDWGYRLVTMATDIRLLTSAAAESVQTMRELLSLDPDMKN